jgi:uncharacterized protein YegP (UPF0339 family)
LKTTIEFQIRDSDNRAEPYYWRAFETGNSTILCSSETYVNKQDAVNGAFLVRNGSASAQVLDYMDN